VANGLDVASGHPGPRRGWANHSPAATRGPRVLCSCQRLRCAATRYHGGPTGRSTMIQRVRSWLYLTAHSHRLSSTEPTY